MSSGSKKKGLKLKGKDRGRELQSALVEWRLRGMSKAQSTQLAELFDETANSPPLTDKEFAEVLDHAWAEVRQITKEKHFRDLTEFEVLPVDYLIEPLVPIGCTSILDGNPGMGKSFLSLAMAAAVTTGGHFCEVQVARKGRVLLLNDEDDPSRVLRPRLEAIGADIGKIRVIDTPFTLNDENAEILRREVRRYDPALGCIDIQGFPSGVMSDSWVSAFAEASWGSSDTS